jgi:hypothetical protein
LYRLQRAPSSIARRSFMRAAPRLDNRSSWQRQRLCRVLPHAAQRDSSHRLRLFPIRLLRSTLYHSILRS